MEKILNFLETLLTQTLLILHTDFNLFKNDILVYE